MADDLEFEPRLGRVRGGGMRRGRTLSRIIAATNRARAGGGKSRRFTGSRIGRGAGSGRILSARDSYAAFRQRRAIIKSRIVKLAGKGFAAASAHLRYVERDGTSRRGERGQLYSAGSEGVDRREFLERCGGDRHQFRFIVSPEDGLEYEDLRHFTRRLMERMEDDLGTGLDWVAVDHFNTGHPHSHIIVRGRDDRGKDLIIARDYITHGMRERACELLELDLGPRGDRVIEDRLRHDVDQERLTSIDRSLVRGADEDGLIAAGGRNAFEQSIRIGRLRKLERLGLAQPEDMGRWRLDPNVSDALRRMGERGDIIRTMQRAYSEQSGAPPLADRLVYDPAASGARPLVGRIVRHGLSDELNDRHYLIVEATDGRSYYIDIGKSGTEQGSPGTIVRIEPMQAGIRDVDRTVVEVAAANGGLYSVDLHLAHDPSATQDFAETHVRRLEAIRRMTGGVTRELDGSWLIAPDHLDRASAFEASRLKDRPVAIEILSPMPLEKLVAIDAATWLDRGLVAAGDEPARDAGFGKDVRAAQALRRQWLIGQGLAEEADGQTIYRSGMIEVLRRRELLRVAAALSDELGKEFADVQLGDRIAGTLRRPVELLGGRMALIERSREFSLVPWRPILDLHIGKNVSGMMREAGVNWTLGRSRAGPAIS